MEKRWVVCRPENEETVDKLSKQLNIPFIVASLLVNRGIKTFEEARYFFRPTLAHLHNPFLMQDMDKAIQRIEQAIHASEKIIIYGDYDVDGTTAVSLVYTFLKQYHQNIDFYIPDRYKEGYGISFQGIDWAAQQEASLIIALDCGIKSINEINYAKEKNIDFIICDHHLPGAELPNAIAVLDPKRSDCNYPYKELSGCGIGFKLVDAFRKKKNIPFEEIEPFLDLVVVSIASDLVPVTDENRVLAYFGLIQLNKNPRSGLKALIELADKKHALTINDIVFFIGPRINAAGRIDDAKHAVNLLIAENDTTARDYCRTLHTKNTERKVFDSTITSEALEMLETDPVFYERKSTVLFNPDWHKGVIGIVASRVLEKYYRPTIILTESNGMVSGSARSVNGFDIYNAISACSDLLEQYGGHQYAAGLTLRLENVTSFTNRFEEVVASTIQDHSLKQEIKIEAELNLKDFTGKFYRLLNQFEPFGPENMKPIFLSQNVVCVGEVSLVGKNSTNHLKFSVRQNESATFECIGFNMGTYKELLLSKRPFNICYTIEENKWKDKLSIQLNIKDISN